MWLRKRRKRRRPVSTSTKHYRAHKEAARELVHARLAYFNNHYQYSYNRVSIKNQRRCWGSCSSLRNLNFSYKLMFLPVCLRDYIIVHELCHLQEMNHGPAFWALVAEQVPDYQERVRELKKIERQGTALDTLTVAKTAHTCQWCEKQ